MKVKQVPTRTYKTGKTWNTGSKKYAISDSNAEIALKYGKTVSQGIREMEKLIGGNGYGN